jgi:long-subunit acyl-CoA synthetase (AMP-forming)
MLVGHAKPFLAMIVTGKPPMSAVEAAIDKVNTGQPSAKRIKRPVLVDETFTPENGLLTANRKLRRLVIEEHFDEQIEAVYEAYRAEKEEKARQREAPRS